MLVTSQKTKRCRIRYGGGVLPKYGHSCCLGLLCGGGATFCRMGRSVNKRNHNMFWWLNPTKLKLKFESKQIPTKNKTTYEENHMKPSNHHPKISKPSFSVLKFHGLTKPGTAGSTMTTMLTTLALALIGGAQVVYGVPRDLGLFVMDTKRNLGWLTDMFGEQIPLFYHLCSFFYCFVPFSLGW